MPRPPRSEAWQAEIEPLQQAFLELICVRAALRSQQEVLSASRRSLRGLKRAEKAIQREARHLLSELFSRGLSRSEVGVLYGKAEREAQRRLEVASTDRT